MAAPDILVSGDREISLWDAITFYQARIVLPDRQQQSLQFCLYENLKEKDAAVRMGILSTNPVSIYATIGITTLLGLALTGDIFGYYLDPLEVFSVAV